MLIVFVVVIAVLLLLGAVMLLAYFGHPDDKNEAWVPKFITVGCWLLVVCVENNSLKSIPRLWAYGWPLAPSWPFRMTSPILEVLVAVSGWMSCGKSFI